VGNGRRHEMPGKPGPQHWHELAKETRAKADQIKDARSKRRMLGIAESYERLAELLEQFVAGKPHVWKRRPPRRRRAF
jgi:hypothetical protein